jgi:pyrophosphatase PpaX
MPIASGQIACVIFDMDGTLTQTNELIFASFNHVAQKHLGKTFSPEEIIAMFGPPETGAVKNLFGETVIGTAMEELIAYYREHHPRLARLHRGIDDVLRYLQDQGVRLALFTGKGIRTTTITLEAFGLTSFFPLVVSGDDVQNHKPHPEGIQRVLDRYQLRREQVLMVGDSMADVGASRAAGVAMAAVLWDSYDKERVLGAGADLVFHHVDEMMAWFRHHLN